MCTVILGRLLALLLDDWLECRVGHPMATPPSGHITSFIFQPPDEPVQSVHSLQIEQASFPLAL